MAPDTAESSGRIESSGPIERVPFEYAVFRVIPRIERGEAFNAGVIVHCRPRRFLGVRVHLDETLLGALAPACDPAAVRDRLTAIARIAEGAADAGPIARLSAPERFHWLVAPASTIVQAAEVHTGVTADPARTLEHLFRSLVLREPSPDPAREPVPGDLAEPGTISG